MYFLIVVSLRYLHNSRNWRSAGAYSFLAGRRPSSRADAGRYYSSRTARYSGAWHSRRRWRCAANWCSSAGRPGGST